MSYNQYQQHHFNALFGEHKSRNAHKTLKMYNLLQARGIVLASQPYGICAAERKKRVMNGTQEYILKIEPVEKKKI